MTMHTMSFDLQRDSAISHCMNKEENDVPIQYRKGVEVTCPTEHLPFALNEKGMGIHTLSLLKVVRASAASM